MRARIVVLAVAAVLASAGCGVPTGTGVQVDGPMGEAGLSGSDDVQVPPGPDDAQTAEQLVEYFLQAAAGDPDDAAEQLRGFVHSDQRDDWQPEPQVMVVRAEDPIFTPVGPAQHRVQLEVRWVGTLTGGLIEPRDGTERRTYDFEVASESTNTNDGEFGMDAGDDRLRIVDPPNVVLLSDEALATSTTATCCLEPSPIYFWDSDNSVLVPDLRWVSTALTAVQRAQAKLEWLTDGPATWLDSVARLPGDVALEGNVVPRDDRLEITLTPAAADVDHGQLDAQLWWTLRPELTGGRTARLFIGGQDRIIAEAESANPSVRSAPPHGYVVADGALHRHPTDPDFAPQALLDADIRAAALDRDGNIALTHVDADDRYGLGIAAEDSVVDTGLEAAQMSRPVWLSQPGGIGLVAADGLLYRFSHGGDPAQVQVPGLTGAITAVAAAPDGRRLAMVADGDLYVSSMVRRDDGSVSVSTAQRLPTAASDLAGVTFIQENWLAVVGQEGGRSLLYELTVDGAAERELPAGDLGAPQAVTNVVGFPGSPLSSTAQRGSIMYETGDGVYLYRSPSSPSTVSLESVETTPRAPLFVE